MKTYKIELRMDDSDKEKVRVMKEAVMVAAKHLLATAALIADRRKPQVAMFEDDSFTAQEEIELAADLE